jgi:DNA-binding response OmpR family regulator
MLNILMRKTPVATNKEDVTAAELALKDDYLIKPFDKDELHARILVGLRVMKLQEALVRRVAELEAAACEIRSLKLQLPL